ncbi:adhesion G protein-coupled receptor F5-like isoform X1 [Acipenser ruthenus]|uniref:adhesion G protein-coupled receptor F5-like isoform X1 n=1 Tax=Acipenser ruthenus TaxID=7906 RepID=UPI0027426EA7|nr:adhesion G protein-coupled receptor F5-like isoform X1 [Acipenser ruthenus]
MAMYAVNLYSIILLLLVNISQAEVVHGYEDEYHLIVGSTTVNNKYQIHAPLRQKREATDFQEYFIDIEVLVNISDESFLDGLKQFLKKNISYPLNVEQNVSVTDGVLTTICTLSGENTQCKCEKAYAWSSANCSKFGSCSGDSTDTCDCIKAAPPDGLYCQAKLSFVMKMAFSMNLTFISALNNKSSPEYNQYKSDIEDAITQSYSAAVKGFQTVAVTGFRNGSVIVDYEIVTTGTSSSSDLQAGNNKITSALLVKSYQVDQSSFIAVVTDKIEFTSTPTLAFEGDTLILNCVIRVNYSKATWKVDDTDVKVDGRHVISKTENGTTLIVQPGYNGNYTCIFEDSFVIYKHTEQITVKGKPTITSTSPVTAFCDETNDLKCCITPYMDYFTVGWSDGKNTLNGVKSTNNPYCSIYTPTAEICKSKSGLVLSYTCEIKTGFGAVWLESINVTFIQMGTKTEMKIQDVSSGDGTTITCTTDIINKYNTSWYLKQDTGEITVLKPSGSVWSSSSEQNKMSLTITNVNKLWEGEYRCEFSYESKNTSAKARMNVYSLPTITVSPEKKKHDCNSDVNNEVVKCCIPVGSETYTMTFNTDIQPGDLIASQDQMCANFTYLYPETCEVTHVITCKVTNQLNKFITKNITLDSFRKIENEVLCSHPTYGIGQDHDSITTACPPQQTGNITVECKSGNWIVTSDTCVLKAIDDIFFKASQLTNSPKPVQTELPSLIEELKNTSTKLKNNITSSTATISSVVNILSVFSKTAENITISKTELTGFLETVNNVIGLESIKSWKNLNNQETDSSSSRLLQSVELFTKSLSTNSSFNLETNNINLKATKITTENSSYNEAFTFNNTKVSGSVNIPASELSVLNNTFIVAVAYLSLSDILPSRNNTTNKEVNGIVLTAIVHGNVKSVALDFGVKNTSLGNPQCVFWNFTLYNNTGSWDDFGCKPEILGNSSIRCRCEHLTSFSILMSPKEIKDSGISEALDYITYIGLGVSMGSLVLCLLIEAIVWQSVNKNKTSYIRHVSIVNLALSLLIADIWFIIGAAIDASTPACSAATFFIHFFYLALFFWMLTLAILLFFRVVLVFKDLGKSQMLAIAFCLGYGCPLIIAVVSVAVTAPEDHYTRKDTCWLNWDNTMVLLAFVIPALVIITINLIILIVVIFKMLRRTIGDKPRAEETSTLKVVARCIAILTPFLGLTWGFGIGMVVAPDNKGIHVVFTVLNAFQGFFVLVFGTLLDSKIRDALLKTFSLSRNVSQQTRSTTGGVSSGNTNYRPNIFGQKKTYRVHEVSTSSNSTSSYSVLS